MGLCVYDSISVKAFRKLLPACSVILLVLVLTFLGLRHTYAMDVKLEWDKVFDADHYEIWWGSSSRDYTDSAITYGTSYNRTLPDDTYYFAVRAVGYQGLKSGYSREVCVLGPTELEPGYDRGWGITSGNLAGFKVMYHSNDPTPTLGPSNALPLIPAVNAVGVPLNLQPSPGPPFATPVKIFIPCPRCSDVSQLNIYYYDGSNWFLANDADAPDIVQPDAIDWMEPGSRENDNTSIPPTIGVRILHFSGVQAGTSAPNNPGNPIGKEGAGGCFIDAAASP